jgi:hypothetical protein
VQGGRRGGHVAPQGRSFWRSGQAKNHTDMRLTCGPPVVGCVLAHLKLLLAARGPPKTSFEPRRGWGIVFRNSRNSLSAGRRACKPAAKPAMPGATLLRYGFVCYERTPGGSGGRSLAPSSWAWEIQKPYKMPRATRGRRPAAMPMQMPTRPAPRGRATGGGYPALPGYRLPATQTQRRSE